MYVAQIVSAIMMKIHFVFDADYTLGIWMKPILRSEPANVFTFKFWTPVLLAAPFIAINYGDLVIPRLFLTLPLLIVAAFFASLAIVEVREGALRYRRLFAWKEIPFDDILNIRIDVSSAIASFRLKKPLFPWGRLYFVLDRNLRSNPFHKGEYALIKYILHVDRNGPEVPFPAEPAREPIGTMKLLLAASAGIVLFSAAVLLGPAPPSSLPSSHISAPGFVGFLYQIAGILTSFKVQLAYPLVFALLAIFRRRDEHAWVYAFIAGGSLPHIVLHLLKSV